MEGYEVRFVFVFWKITFIKRGWESRGLINWKFEIKIAKVTLFKWYLEIKWCTNS